AMEKAGPVVKRGADAAASAMEKAGPAVKRGADAAASAMEKAGPAAKRGADAAASAMEKASPKLRRNMKIICIAALAVVVLVLIFSRRTGGKEDSFLDQFQGNWELAGMYVNMFTSPATPRSVSITENALHIGTNYKPNPTLAIPLSETEYKDGALCFTSQIYNTSGTAVYEAGLQDYNMRLTYDESEEGLVLEYELSVDNELGWYKLVWYKSVE
ncbi:MAG TPA: hypothetical protein DCZ91_07265, partial [Lachnospiraceae bacterium]|nr:hypothetical protein [Lachnospiraceae bacterium]